jgi:hypothetical protein
MEIWSLLQFPVRVPLIAMIQLTHIIVVLRQLIMTLGLELLQAALQGVLTSNMFAIIIAVLVFSCIYMFFLWLHFLLTSFHPFILLVPDKFIAYLLKFEAKGAILYRHANKLKRKKKTTKPFSQ